MPNLVDGSGSKGKFSFLDRLFSDPNNLDTNQISSYLQNYKQQGATDDDLKPYYDKLLGAGYSIGADGSITKAASGTTPRNSLPPPVDTNAKIPTPSQLPTDVPGQTIPGPDINLNSDRGSIEQEAAREKQQSLDVLGQQRDIRQGNISPLMDILKKQADAQFSYDLPGIKEQLQGSGVLNSDSALGNAIARESSNLLAPQLSALSQYGLNANDQYASGLGSILGQQEGLQQSGLQRQFSLADWDKQANLAREIGASAVPSNGFSLTGALGGAAGAGAAAYPLAASNPYLYAGLTAGSALAGGSKSGGGTYLCTHLKNLGLMTEDEVKAVHSKVFPYAFLHPFWLLMYGLLAPGFILRADSIGFDWKLLKPIICDEIIESKTQKEAFEKYKKVCLRLFGLEVCHG